MLRTVMLSKLHRVTVTQTDIDYVGSITIDKNLLDASGMKVNEKVDIYDIDNGNRLSTYIIEGKPGSGIIGINGAAARLVSKGDKAIIVNYGLIDPKEFENTNQTVVLVDDENQVTEIIND